MASTRGCKMLAGYLQQTRPVLVLDLCPTTARTSQFASLFLRTSVLPWNDEEKNLGSGVSVRYVFVKRSRDILLTNCPRAISATWKLGLEN